MRNMRHVVRTNPIRMNILPMIDVMKEKMHVSAWKDASLEGEEEAEIKGTR